MLIHRQIHPLRPPRTAIAPREYGARTFGLTPRAGPIRISHHLQCILYHEHRLGRSLILNGRPPLTCPIDPHLAPGLILLEGRPIEGGHRQWQLLVEGTATLVRRLHRVLNDLDVVQALHLLLDAGAELDPAIAVPQGRVRLAALLPYRNTCALRDPIHSSRWLPVHAYTYLTRTKGSAGDAHEAEAQTLGPERFRRFLDVQRPHRCRGDLM